MVAPNIVTAADVIASITIEGLPSGTSVRTTARVAVDRVLRLSVLQRLLEVVSACKVNHKGGWTSVRLGGGGGGGMGRGGGGEGGGGEGGGGGGGGRGRGGRGGRGGSISM